MGDQDELGPVRASPQTLHEAVHIGVVEGRVRLVEDDESRRLKVIGGQEQGDTQQGLFPTGHLEEAPESSAGVSDFKAHPAVEGVRGIKPHEPSLVTVQEVADMEAQRLVETFQDDLKALEHLAVQSGEGRLKSFQAIPQVRLLASEEAVSLGQALVFLKGHEVDGTHRRQFILQSLKLTDVAGRRGYFGQEVCRLDLR
jgi:hypothetical protein